MAQVFNPWAQPPNTGTLTGDLASFEINDMEGPDSEAEAEAPEPEDLMMQQALSVISQQAALIEKLMKTLGK